MTIEDRLNEMLADGITVEFLPDPPRIQATKGERSAHYLIEFPGSISPLLTMLSKLVKSGGI